MVIDERLATVKNHGNDISTGSELFCIVEKHVEPYPAYFNVRERVNMLRHMRRRAIFYC